MVMAEVMKREFVEDDDHLDLKDEEGEEDVHPAVYALDRLPICQFQMQGLTLPLAEEKDSPFSTLNKQNPPLQNTRYHSTGESRSSRRDDMESRREEAAVEEEKRVVKVREFCNREKEDLAEVRYYNTHNNKQ